MAQLVQSFTGDTALRLQDEEYIRKMQWGTDWTHVKIGFLCAMPQATGNLGAQPILYVGLCQGTSDGRKSASTTEWVGWQWGNGVNNWNYNSIAGPINFYLANGGWARSYKVGASVTTGAFVSSSSYLPVNFRYFYTFDFLRTTTGYNLGYTMRSAAFTAADADVNEINFLMYTPVDTSGTFGAVDFATNNLLDAVSFYWNYPSVGLELSSIVVVRII